MIKPFAKLFQFDDIGQVLVKLDEAEDPDTSGPEIVISFKPENLGVCAVKLSKFGPDGDEAWDKADKAFETIDEAFAYKTAKKVIDEFNDMFAGDKA
ncbi:hypothetical protein CNR34_00051 [Pseudomonas phage nickie]|uniref:Uncharacterized protein n=1 Tax=Pseudomonas phage nickie TaxID=2048977 RepID=A0A2H4P724_9CAUD|nr:hypothetical protein FDJ16_gp114 [Pseudomonas phage nickie]ATW57984.1 hypothetical protein CNR34_00051 [Pseudomonas phage nickie]